MEHRYEHNLEIVTGGKAQALVVNYEVETVDHFGPRYSLADRLRFPISLQALTAEGCERLQQAAKNLPKKWYSREFCERVVRLVFEQVEHYASQWEAIGAVASKLGVSGETLRKWVRQAEVDAGARPGPSSEESAELKRLRREVAELRRANEI